MDLQEEYFARRAVRGHMVKFCDKGSLLLKARNDVKKPEWEWLQVSIIFNQDGQHPGWFQFHIQANPVIYATSDFTHFTYQHMKNVGDPARYEFEAYEAEILKWAEEISKSYTAISSSDAIFVSWEMFCSNYDSWLAGCLSWRMIDSLSKTLSGTKEERLKFIADVETWMKERHERVFLCWRNIKQNLENKNYSDWLARIVNNMQHGRVVAYTREDLAKEVAVI